jgi:nicotinate-nucleotide adenylyltransferase
MNYERLTKKRVALLGGAFNPPHNGHVMIARQVLDFARVDRVWLLPNFRQSPPKPVAPAEDRLAMTRFLEGEKIDASSLEIDHRLDGQTINLLPYLPPENDYIFVIGSDQLPAFHLWGEWEKLLARLPFLVFPRYGYPNEPLYANMTVLSHKLLVGSNLSSTKIRGRVAAGLSIDAFVPQRVAEYIKENKLYQI